MMTREQFLDTLRAMLVVVPVTLLIWLLAESESLRTEKLRVEVEFTTPTETARSLRVVPGQEFTGAVAVTVEGPNARVDRLSTFLRGAIRLEPGMPGVPLDPGTHAVDLRAAIASYPAVRESGITIAEATPSAVTVQIEALATREAKINVELPPGVRLDGAVEVSPVVARVRLPEHAVRLLSPPGSATEDPQIVARVPLSAVLGLPEGRRAVINAVPLELPQAVRELPGVRLQPAQATVSLTPRAPVATMVLADVPVHVRIAPVDLTLWDVEFATDQSTLPRVPVIGPVDAIDPWRALIESGQASPAVSVAISTAEIEAAYAGVSDRRPAIIEKPPVLVDAPLGVRVDGELPPVRLIVFRRAGR